MFFILHQLGGLHNSWDGLEIRANYPNKQIVAFTNSGFNAAYNQYLTEADFVIDKSVPLDDWITMLDEQVRIAYNPKEQWIKIRDSLLKSGIDTIDVAQIEDQYVRAMKTKQTQLFNKYVQKLDNPKVKEMLLEFTSSLASKLILGVIA